MKKGVQVTAGADVGPACEFAYEASNVAARFIKRDVESLSAAEVQSHSLLGTHSLLAGCAPCQPFSAYAKGRETSQDSKWRLLRSFASLVKEANPDLVTMENVPQLPSREIFDEFLGAFEGYHTWFDVVQCEDYGIPQRRRRLVSMASKLGPIELIPPTHKSRPL